MRKRKENVRKVRPRILIVCEDGKSAPNYFNGFRLSSATVAAVGTGKNTLSLVTHAIQLRDSWGYDQPTDQVWVVMDRDSFPQANYDNSFAKGEAHGVKVVFSNECLEVWFLLHFTSSTAPISRKKIPGILSKYIGKRYEKGMDDIFLYLFSGQDAAIKNAEILRRHHLKSSATSFENCCPATDIDILVKELRRFK